MVGVLLAMVVLTAACAALPRVTWLRWVVVAWTLPNLYWLLHAVGHVGRNVARPDAATMANVVPYRDAWGAAVESANAFTKPHVLALGVGAACLAVLALRRGCNRPKSGAVDRAGAGV